MAVMRRERGGDEERVRHNVWSRMDLELNVLFGNTPRLLLPLLIPLHRRQRIGPDHEFPPANCERQVLANAISRPSAAFATLGIDGQFMHFQHPLRLIVGFCGARAGLCSGCVHEVREGREF